MKESFCKHFSVIFPEFGEHATSRALNYLKNVTSDNFGSFIKLVFLYNRVVSQSLLSILV